MATKIHKMRQGIARMLRLQEGRRYNAGDPYKDRTIYSIIDSKYTHAFWLVATRSIAEDLQSQELMRRSSDLPEELPEFVIANTALCLEESVRTSAPILQGDGTLWRTFAIFNRYFNVAYHVHTRLVQIDEFWRWRKRTRSTISKRYQQDHPLLIRALGEPTEPAPFSLKLPAVDEARLQRDAKQAATGRRKSACDGERPVREKRKALIPEKASATQAAKKAKGAANGSAQQRELRTTCDLCQSRKVFCCGNQPCTECFVKGEGCIFSPKGVPGPKKGVKKGAKPKAEAATGSSS